MPGLRPFLWVVLFGLSTTLVAPSCSDQSSGGKCGFKVDHGVARVISVEPTLPDSASCVLNPMVVRLQFGLTSAEASGEGGANFIDYTWAVPLDRNPPEACLEATGVVVGSELPVVRTRATGGACTPLHYDLETDSSLCEDLCDCGDGYCGSKENVDLCPEDCE